MSEESHLSQPIPLSQAQKLRRLNYNHSDKIEISEKRLIELMTGVINREVSSKIARLENSINKMVLQFEGVKNENSEDAALRFTTDSEASDLAVASVIPKEDLYSYLCQDLAEKLEIRKYDVIQMIKKLKLRNNDKYHLYVKYGVKNGIHKWSEATYQRLKQALESGEYPRPIID